MLGPIFYVGPTFMVGSFFLIVVGRASLAHKTEGERFSPYYHGG